MKINANKHFLRLECLWQDTVVAFQALTEYANRARMREITDMTVYIEVSSQQETDPIGPVKFSPENASACETIDVIFHLNPIIT